MNGHVKTSAQSQLEVAIGMLLESANDKSQLVSESVHESIRKLSEKYSNQVLISSCRFCARNPKPSHEHISHILNIMEKICTDYIIEIDGDTVLLIVDFALQIMTENVHYEPIIQMPASNVLVALGRKHHIQVIESLFKKLEAGVIPHYMIAHTLGTLANVNAYGVVPYMKNILHIMLPLLGGVKVDPLKQAFSYALGSFCEALLEYTSNLEQVPDNTITTESFQVEVNMAYDVLFASWLQSKEPKVIESVLNALAAIYPMLDVDKVTQQTAKIIHTLMNLYKKSANPYSITKCLGAVIQKAASVNGTLLEPLLSNILQNLSDLVCVSPDYAQPDLLRNHSEVLRCYECFALHFTDHTIDQLLIQMRNNNEKERVKAILVITHLTSYTTENAIQRRFKDILRQVSEMLNDPNIRVKKALMKIIVAFSCKGVLLNKEISPDGPEKYMEFLLKLCCKPGLYKNTDVTSDELFDMQKTADNTLCMLSTSVPELEASLWHLLMKCFLGPAFDDAIVVMLRCLTHLASRKSTAEVCTAAFVRCVVLLSVPLTGFRGTFILNFLKNIRPSQDDSYKSVWETKLPQLVKYLEQNYENLHQLEWQDMVFDFLSVLLETVNDEKFSEEVLGFANKQLEMYNNNRFLNGGNDLSTKQCEKQFLLKCLAIILCHLTENEIISHTLDHILINVKLPDFAELYVCAEAVGICSRVHLELVLNKLSLIRKDILMKKSKFSPFFLIKDQKHELNLERVRYVIICSYAEICNEASGDELLRVIQTEILEFVVNELTNSKGFTVKKICLRALGAIADAMHPNRNSLHIRMDDRDKVLQLVSSQIHLHSGPEYIELFPDILPVITSLTRLPLPLESEQRLKILKLCFDNVFNASAIYCRINSDNHDYYYGDLKLVPYVTASFTRLNQLVEELLMQNISPATLDEITTLLEPWLGRKKAEQRLPAVETLKIVLQTYLDNMKFAYDCPTSFGQTGFLLAKIVPRCSDPNTTIRKIATESLCLVLCISSRYEGHMKDHDKQLSNSLQHIQQQIESDDPKLLYNLTSDLAQVICSNLPHFQLIHFVDGLIEALLDCESSSSTGSSVVLSMTLKAKGGELQHQVGTVLDKMISQLEKIRCPRTRSSTLRSILNLATHHSKVVCQILLAQPLPFNSSICDCWAVLSTDDTLVLDLFDQLKKVIKQTALYEIRDSDEVKIVNIQPLQAVCALHELLKNTQLKAICKQNYPELFAILLVTLASYIGTDAPAISGDKREKYGFVLNRDAYKLKPAKVALDTFKLFLLCCEYTQTTSYLLNLTNIEVIDNIDVFLDTVAGLVEGVCAENPAALSWLVAALGPYIRAELEPQRVVVMVFFAFLLKQKANNQSVLAENLLEMILDVQMDESCLVRKIALQGLGFAVESLNFDLVSRHSHPILSVFMNSLDYSNIGNESDVILEGMLSFSKLLTNLEGHKFSTCQVTAAVRIKPLLDHDDAMLRRASFRLLGDLTLSLTPDVNIEAFREQIEGDFIPLILHLCDPDGEVIRACKYTLRKVSVYLETPKVTAMIQEHLIDEANLHYADFVKDLIKIMADEMQELFSLFIMTSLSYLKSPWVELRSNAALLIGLLFSHMKSENKHRVSLDTICDRLMRLLNDDSEDVRVRAVESIAYLFIN